MEEVVEVVADVEQGCLQPQSTNSDIGKDFEQDSIEAARKIREHQGDHEAEVSCRGESDLHKHYKRCKKNPGHIQFIPVGDFKIEHLPSGYRDDVILDWIRAEADLTCRLSVKYTSESRPEFYPGTHDPYPFYQDGGNWLRTGTGSVRSAQRYTEKDNKNCECRECSGPGTHTPQKSWGEVTIVTACHVVFACDEARHTMCRFFYDRSTSYVSDFPTLTGLRVEYTDIEGDLCVMTCVTHDMDLVDKLVKMCDRRLELFDKVSCKYWLDQLTSMLDPAGVSYVTDPTPGPIIVISHPYGCSKQISVGEWTHRQTEEETDSYKEETDVFSKCINSSYRFNAATCPGSSGAPVIRLLEKGRVGGWWWLLYSHPHSGGGAGNDNYSGRMGEYIAFSSTMSHQIFSKMCLSRFAFCVIILTSLFLIIHKAITGVWGVDSPWIGPCLLVIPVLFYTTILFSWPRYRQQRVFQWSLFIAFLLFLLHYLCWFVVILVVDYDTSQQITVGVVCVFYFVGLLIYFRDAKARNRQLSLDIQRGYRQIKKLVVGTTTVKFS